jgi:hypothetical protein
LQPTLTPALAVVALRRTLLVSLDDLLAVVHEFLNPNAALGPGPVSASAWGEQPARSQGTSTEAEAHAVQGA